jgi:predicted outer membrane repeat protein
MLSTALGKLINSSGGVYINPGVYDITGRFAYKDLNDVGLIGQGKDAEDVIIRCNGSGLSFTQVDNLNMKLITFINCGIQQLSTNRNVFDKQTVYVTINVAIYMMLCINVTLSNIHFINSNNTALALYNVAGNVTITECTFNGTSSADVTQYGTGGGLIIEFSYCIPQGTICYTKPSPIYTTSSSYAIFNSSFVNNIATRGGKFEPGLVYSFNGLKNNSYNLGNGGGLAIILKGDATRNTFHIDHCTFDNNVAHYGGGFYISFMDNTTDNNVDIVHSTFTENINDNAGTKNFHFNVDANGGGGTVIFASGTGGPNNVTISHCNFTSNHGLSGGALSIQAIANFQTLSGNLLLDNLIFSRNMAYLGAAMYIFLDNTHPSYSLNVQLNSSNFTDNSLLCLDSVQRSLISLPCFGILYVITQKINISGVVHFEGNEDSCIEVHYTHVTINRGTEMYFDGNFAQSYGSSIALYDCSYIKVYDDTKLTFINNVAKKFGGAIYSGECRGLSQTASLSSYCFISYYIYGSHKHPDSWDSHFQFINNIDSNGGNSIYSSSMMSCLWPDEDTFTAKTNESFCWKSFNYTNSNCSYQVSSGPAYMTINTDSGTDIIPGDFIPKPTFINWQNRTMNSSLSETSIVAGPGTFSRKLERKARRFNRDVQLFRYGSTNSFNESVKVIMSTTDSNGLEVAVSLKFTNCSWPYQMTYNNHNISYCGLNPSLYYIYCSIGTEQLKGNMCDYGLFLQTDRSYCISKYYNDDFIIGHCPLSYSKVPLFKPYWNIPPSKDLCNKNHTGVLCGQCTNGTGIAINSLHLECVDCTNAYILLGWVILIFVQLLPLTILVLVVVVCHINLVQSIAWGFVLYCQLLSVNFPGFHYPIWLSLRNNASVFKDEDLTYSVAGFYSIPNLNFFVFFTYKSWHICLSQSMTPLAAISFWYVIAFYPLFILLILYVWITLYARGYKYILILTIPLHKCLARFWHYFKIQMSLTDAIASIYMLCYVQILATSLKIIDYSTWQSLKHQNATGRVFFYDGSLVYFGWPHAIFGVFAHVITFLFILVPTISLLFYQFKWFNACLNYFNLRHQLIVSLADTFTGSFKNSSDAKIDCRCFASFYFLFRAFLLVLYYMKFQSHVVLYCQIIISALFAGLIMIFRPHKSIFANFIEFLIILNMCFMSALCATLNEKGRSACLYAIIHIPLIVIVIYCTYILAVKCHNYYKRKSSNILPPADYSDLQATIQDDELPDRVLNPDKYQETHVPFSPGEDDKHEMDLPDVTSADETKCTIQPSLKSSIRATDSDYGSTVID